MVFTNMGYTDSNEIMETKVKSVINKKIRHQPQNCHPHVLLSKSATNVPSIFSYLSVKKTQPVQMVQHDLQQSNRLHEIISIKKIILSFPREVAMKKYTKVSMKIFLG